MRVTVLIGSSYPCQYFVYIYIYIFVTIALVSTVSTSFSCSFITGLSSRRCPALQYKASQYDMTAFVVNEAIQIKAKRFSFIFISC